MKSRAILMVLAVSVIATLACTITIPTRRYRVGPTQTKEIEVPLPEEGEEADLSLGFGAGRLNVKPGAEDFLVQGTARYNVEEFEPRVSIDGEAVRIEQGPVEDVSIPSVNLNDIENSWSLKLADVPMSLDIKAGAYEGEFELGGLSLTELDIQDGASKSEVSFGQPNKVEMHSLRYQTGASSVSLTGLANANFDRLDFGSGAGNYLLDFSGELQRDARVTINSGVSSVTIVVPEGTNAHVTFEGALTDVDLSGEWKIEGGDYVQEGEGPTLTIVITMAAGSVRLGN
jgi:hypothetical protein